MNRKYFTLVVAIVYSAFFWFFLGYSAQSLLIKRLSNSLGDMLYRVRYTSDSLPASRDKLVVIAIDDESSSKLNLRWPWPRMIFAEIVNELSRKGVSVIGLNFTFTGAESDNGDSTEAFAEAIKRHGRVVVGSSMEGERLLKPSAPILSAGAQIGFLEKIVDDDFVIRKSYLKRAYRYGGDEKSFPLALWRAGDATDRSLEGWTAKDGSYVINYLVKEGDIRTISAWKLLEGRVAQEALRGKTALVGITSSLLSEKHYTPLGLMSGLYVHANEWISLEEGRSLHVFSPQTSGFISWVAGLILLLFFLTRRLWLSIFGYGCAIFLIFLAGQFFISRDIATPFFVLLSGPVLSLAIGFAASLLSLFLENQGLARRIFNDKMTGLYNYEYLRIRLDDEWKRCTKFRLPVSVVMSDLDRFKNINDTLGHEMGNQMILRAAGVIRESVRGYDVVSRYGGDEFVILLWHSSRSEAEAYRVRLRNAFEAMAQKLDDPLLKASSISIGIATFDPTIDGHHPKNPQDLIERADKDLFADKNSRRRAGDERR